jgi:purine nucleosidase
MNLGSLVMNTHLKKIVIDSDAANEIDDQYAITYAILSGSFGIRGFTAAHFGKDGSMEQSHKEILHVLNVLGKRDSYPVLRGAGKELMDHTTPRDSDGAQFIIREALESEDHLHVICMGPLTNLASAYLMEPAIHEKIKCLWLAGRSWPEGGLFFNNRNDIIAAQVIFSSRMKLTLIPAVGTASSLKIYRKDRPHIKKKGAIGDYLWKLFMRKFGLPKSIYDVAAIAALKIPHSCTWVAAPRPELRNDGTYNHARTQGTITVATDINADLIKKDFFASLKRAC